MCIVQLSLSLSLSYKQCLMIRIQIVVKKNQLNRSPQMWSNCGFDSLLN